MDKPIPEDVDVEAILARHLPSKYWDRAKAAFTALTAAQQQGQAVACVACEDKPAPGNNPCGWCGRTTPQPMQQGGVDLGEVVCLACGDHIMPLGQLCHACSHPVSAPQPMQQGGGEVVAEVVLHNNLLYGRLSRDLPVGAKLYAAPPSAPVGVDLHDRVEFALRDAGFDYDEASRIAALAQQPAAVDEATRLLSAYRSAPKFGEHSAIKRTVELEDEIDNFLATQQQEPTT
jgi:hypothetical protein